MTRNAVVLALALSFGVASFAAEIPIGLMRDPDISARHVVFTYADQLWIASREGGRARKLTTLEGPHRFARFSPDGERVAFTRGDAELLAWGDIYTVPANGGAAVRITHHPAAEILNDWVAGGEVLLFFGNGASPLFRKHHLYAVDAEGGLSRKLPVPYGAWAAIDATGDLLAYVPTYSDIGAHWKRYRGGMAADLWLFDLRTGASQKISDWVGNDTMPMWRGRTVYYLSDAGANQRMNVWAYDVDTKLRRQITNLDEFDVRMPAIGPGANGEGEIVFEHGPDLKVLSLADHRVRTLRITIGESDAPARTRNVDAEPLIADTLAIAPGGTAVAVSARGDIWLLSPSAAPRNVTRTDGVAEREPSWSPDGRTLAFFSDRSGEYELTVVPADGSAAPRRVTQLGPGFRTRTTWSPDGKRIAFVDQEDAVWVAEVATGAVSRIDKDRFGFAPELAWAPDSRRVAYTKRGDNFLSRIFVHDVSTGKSEELTGGDYDDTTPAFSPDGQIVYFASTRDFAGTTFGNPRLGDVQRLFVHAEPQVLIAHTLSDRTARRMPLPRAGGRWSFHSLATNDRGQVLYTFIPLGHPPTIRIFDPATSREEVLVEGAYGFVLSADRKTIAYRSGGKIHLRPAAAGATAATVTTSPMPMTIDVRKEWRQLYGDGWRIFRDYFYDAKMHGVDWSLMRTRYARMLERSSTRRDVNYVINEMINELNVSHAEASGGDHPSSVSVRMSRLGASFDVHSDVGLVGADLMLVDGKYRFTAVYRGDATLNLAGPLDGKAVNAGDYLLAVEGEPLRRDRDPYASFIGRTAKPTRITVSAPDGTNVREVEIVPAATEADLRYLDWVGDMRRYVDERSKGRIGFISMPFTTIPAQSDFYRQFYGQVHKHALIVDSRWNGGGEGTMQIIESLARVATEYTVVRGSEGRPEPRLVHRGPTAMLISGMTGSGGDGFAHEFRTAQLGKLIGTRTWGGLVGNRGNPGLIDGGDLRVPSRGVYATSGEDWLIEGTGVTPDIPVEADPSKFRHGRDPQLDAAIDELLRELETRTPPPPPPPPPDRTSRVRDSTSSQSSSSCARGFGRNGPGRDSPSNAH